MTATPAAGQGAPRPPLCSATARQRDDPLVATAVTTRRWLLVEHPGPWDFDAFAGSGIDPAVREELVAAVRATGTRLLLVRRPGRIHRSWPRSWTIADASPTVATQHGTWLRDADLVDAARRLTAASAGCDAPDAPEPDEPPLLLVCTHGRHDTCCAVRGRPVAAALAARWPALTWECSHVGGDRFAANLLVLPDGAYYGDVEPAVAIEVVEAHLRGEMSVRHLRGLSTQPPVVQAAVSAVLARYGPAGPRDATCTRVTRTADDAWVVELACTGPLPAAVSATVTRTRRAPALLTCQARQPSSSWEWHVPALNTDHHSPQP